MSAGVGTAWFRRPKPASAPALELRFDALAELVFLVSGVVHERTGLRGQVHITFDQLERAVSVCWTGRAAPHERHLSVAARAPIRLAQGRQDLVAIAAQIAEKVLESVPARSPFADLLAAGVLTVDEARARLSHDPSSWKI